MHRRWISSGFDYATLTMADDVAVQAPFTSRSTPQPGPCFLVFIRRE